MAGRYIPKLVKKEKIKAEIEKFKVVETDKDYVLRLHAEFKTIKEIKEVIVEVLGKESPLNSLMIIEGIIKDPVNDLWIKTYRNRYLKRIGDLAVANKKVRLEDLELLRGKFLDQIRSNACLDPVQCKEFRAVAKGLSEVLMSAKDEIEGKGMTFNQFNVIGDFNDKSDEELANRRDELIKQAERALIGRTSGANDNPEGIIDTQIVEPS